MDGFFCWMLHTSWERRKYEISMGTSENCSLKAKSVFLNQTSIRMGTFPVLNRRCSSSSHLRTIGCRRGRKGRKGKFVAEGVWLAFAYPIETYLRLMHTHTCPMGPCAVRYRGIKHRLQTRPRPTICSSDGTRWGKKTTVLTFSILKK